MTTTPLPAPLVDYLARRDAARADAAATAFAALTDRERALVKEAAVMGFVQGLMRPREDGAPKDSQIVALVVAACLANPDLYPTISGYVADNEDEATEEEAS